MNSTNNIKNRLQNLIINQETDYTKNIYRNPVKEYIDTKIAVIEEKKNIYRFTYLYWNSCFNT